MDWTHVQEIADKKVLYLTTIGRRTGLPREIQIWFVVYRDCFYLFAEQVKPPRGSRTSGAAPKSRSVSENSTFGAVARVLDRDTDRELWDQAAALAEAEIWMG